LDALHAFRKVCELHPQRMDGWRYRAELAEGLGLWEEAADAWSVVYQKMANGRAFEGRIVCMVHAGKAPLVDEETASILISTRQRILPGIFGYWSFPTCNASMKPWY
jgi:hypothetical protein